MGFWIYMLACDLLVPVIMLISGYMMYRHPPKKINGIYGYRTSRSMKNEQTWRFANNYCGRLWIKYGIIMLVLSIPAHFPFVHSDKNVIGVLSTIVVTIQCIVLLFPIALTEIALRKAFDKEGNPK